MGGYPVEPEELSKVLSSSTVRRLPEPRPDPLVGSTVKYGLGSDRPKLRSLPHLVGDLFLAGDSRPYPLCLTGRNDVSVDTLYRFTPSGTRGGKGVCVSVCPLYAWDRTPSPSPRQSSESGYRKVGSGS